MSLAIEYFHNKRLLTRATPEIAFMAEALLQIHLAIPETTALHRQIRGDGSTHSFNSLVISSMEEFGNRPVAREEIERIVAAVAAFPRCSVQTVGNKTLASDCVYQVAESASWLSSHGIFMIRVVTNEYSTTAYFRGDLCDPYALLRELKREPEYKTVLRGHEMNVDPAVEHVGKGNDGIIIESKASNPKFTSTFQLRFNYGWGDCPSGCISHHSWIVECDPISEVEGRWMFKVRLVRELGEPLGDEIRSCLKCGVRGEW